MEQETGPVSRSMEAARINYNRLSRWYDLFAGSEKRFTDLGLRLLNVRPGEQVLEIGFGTGRSLVSLAGAVGLNGKVHGLDVSEGMLRIATARLERSGLAGRVELHLGDACRLSTQNASLDAIFMSFTLELFHTQEIPVVLQECRRVLRRNGRLGVVAMAKGEGALLEKIYEWGHQRYPHVLDCRPIRVRELVEAEGFIVDRAMQPSMWGLPVAILVGRKSGE